MGANGRFVIVDEGAFNPGEVVFGNGDKDLVEQKAAAYNAAMLPSQQKYAVYELVLVKPDPVSLAQQAAVDYFNQAFPQSMAEVL